MGAREQKAVLKDDRIAGDGVVETSLEVKHQGGVNGHEDTTKQERLVIGDDSSDAFIHEQIGDEQQEIINKGDRWCK